MSGRLYSRMPLALLALLAAWPVLRAGMPTVGDGLIHFYRLVELDWAIRHGVLFPRWLPDLGYGYGIPLFVYYPPLAYYAAEVFRLAGLSFAHAMTAAYALSFGLAALGAYLWGREALGEAGGLSASAAYAFAPYLYLDVLARGALPEALALGLLPWVFWAYRRLAAAPGRGAFLRAALLHAALILVHSISALVATPIVWGYALLIWVQGARSKGQGIRHTTQDARLKEGGRNLHSLITNHQLLFIALALLAPLALTAFFWLPALAEIKYVQASQLLIPALDFHNHFLSLTRLFAAPRAFDPRLVFFEFPASLGWPQAALGLIGLAAAGRAVARRERAGGALPVLFGGATVLLLALLTLPVSVRLWEVLPLLRYVQFPWRLVGLASLMLALAAGAGGEVIGKWRLEIGKWEVGSGRWDFVFVALVLIVIWLFSLPWTFTAGYDRLGDPGVADIARYEIETGQLGTTSAGEYLPATVNELPAPDALAARYAESPVISRLNRASLPEGAVVVSEVSGLERAEATVESPEPFGAVFDWFYFPGWQAEIDGAPAGIQPIGMNGLIAVGVPAGRHTVSVRFGPTPLRRAAGAVSLAAVALAAWVVISRPPAPRGLRELHIGRVSGARSVSLVILALILVRAVYLDNFPNPFARSRFDGATVAGISTPLDVNFDGRLALIGLDLPSAQVRSGEVLDFDLYWRPLSAPLDADYSVAAHLVDSEGFLAGQSDSQHPGGVPTSRWRGDQYARDSHQLRVPPGTPPGSYQLTAGVYGAGALGVRDENGVPQGTSVNTAEITVTRPERAPTDAELAPPIVLNQPLGLLTLVGYDVDAGPEGVLAGSPVYVTLYWRANSAPLPPLSARLEIVAGDGVLQSQVFAPGGQGFPTTIWAEGDAVRLTRALRVPADASVGEADLRLTLVGEGGAMVGGPFSLGELFIRAPDRSTARPEIAHPLEANFGGVIKLLGYDLEPDTLVAGPQRAARLTLYWESLAPMSQSFTVFAHMLDGQAHIWGQHDGLPVGGARPTTGWAPGEVLTDPHEFSIDPAAPPGEYLIEIGWYDAASGTRLPVFGPDGQAAGDHVVLARISLAGP